MSRRSIIKRGKINRVRRLEAQQWLRDIMQARIMEMLLDYTPIPHEIKIACREWTDEQKRQGYAPTIDIEFPLSGPIEGGYDE